MLPPAGPGAGAGDLSAVILARFSLAINCLKKMPSFSRRQKKEAVLSHFLRIGRGFFFGFHLFRLCCLRLRLYLWFFPQQWHDQEKRTVVPENNRVALSSRHRDFHAAGAEGLQDRENQLDV
jgi:hypothetical protein